MTEFVIVDEVAAHLSTNASLQVYEEAQLLSELLCPEMLPRLDVFPQSERSVIVFHNIWIRTFIMC